MRWKCDHCGKESDVSQIVPPEGSPRAGPPWCPRCGSDVHPKTKKNVRDIICVPHRTGVKRQDAQKSVCPRCKGAREILIPIVPTVVGTDEYNFVPVLAKANEASARMSEEKKHPPQCCPNCGVLLEDIQSYWSHSDWLEIDDKPFFGIGYDCYCGKCGWSGNIEPDLDSEIMHQRKHVGGENEK